MKTNRIVVGMRPIQDESRAGVGAAGSEPRVAAPLHHFMPYHDEAVDAETIATGCVLLGMLWFACLLLAGCLDAGALA